MILLGNDDITLLAPDIDDGHGWTMPPEPVPLWTGTGSVQPSFGTAATGADAGGGSGPFRPAATLSGAGFLPTDAQPRNGMVLESGGQRFVVSGCRLVTDPSGGNLTCWAVILLESGVTS